MKYFSYSAQALFLGFTLFFCQATAQAEMVSVVGEKVNMRSGPDTRHSILWQIGSGFPLEVLERSGDWLRVRDFEGGIGWVKNTTVNDKAHMIVKANKGSEKSINVRSEPNTNAEIIAQAGYGTVFKTLDRKNGWVQVEHEQGIIGWVNENLLWGF